MYTNDKMAAQMLAKDDWGDVCLQDLAQKPIQSIHGLQIVSKLICNAAQKILQVN